MNVIDSRRLTRRDAMVLAALAWAPGAKTWNSALTTLEGPGQGLPGQGIAAAGQRVARSRKITFSGYEWNVKSSGDAVGPGPNVFSNSEDNVFVDTEGRLHLLINQKQGRWRCAEVVSARSFGLGTYRFTIDSGIDGLDPNVVLGLFTWSDAPEYNHRELDVEIARWGDPANANAQFVVQPYTRKANIVRFAIPTGRGPTTHSVELDAGPCGLRELGRRRRHAAARLHAAPSAYV